MRRRQDNTQRFAVPQPGSARAEWKARKDEPSNRRASGTAVVTDKGLASERTEEFFASRGLDLNLIPSCKAQSGLSFLFLLVSYPMNNTTFAAQKALR